MKITPTVRRILSHYESDSPGTKEKLARMLMQGKLAGTGKLIILPVDQGFEHGPDRSFAANPEAYDPYYLYDLAIDAGMSAYAAPLGALSCGADRYAGAIPTILKMNSSNSLHKTDYAYDQAITASVSDALHLGCAAIGFTIYPSSAQSFEMMEEIRELISEAKSYGLAVVVWSYPRGHVSKDGETAIDVVTYGAHMAALLGAHIIKVKLPSAHIEQAEAKKVFEQNNIDVSTQAKRVAHVVQSCFQGKRLVVFSGGASKSSDAVFDDARAIYEGGGTGSIIGRNSFQRKKPDAIKMLSDVINIYKGKS